MRLGILVFITQILLSGCFGSTTIKDVNEYGVKPMVKADIVPSEAQLEGQSYKVTIIDINDNGVPLADNASVGTAIRGELIKHVSKSNVTMVDHNALPGLKKALQDKTGKFKTSKVDYALSGQVSNTSFKREYVKLSTTKDKKGNIYITEPHCVYSALVQGNINIHSAAEKLDVVESVAISGGANRSIDVPRHYRRCNDLSRTEVNSLIREAGIKAVNREDVLLKNFFRPKGYVLERRIRGKQNIFKISLGKSNGLKADLLAEIYTAEKSKNPLTNKTTVNQSKIGSGTVSNKIDRKHAWIVVDDELVASQVRLGDIVKIKYEKGFFGNIFNRSFNN